MCIRDSNNNVLRPTPQSLYEKAYQCFSDASSHSNADALYNMAILTKYGYGTPKDNVRSMSFLRRASAGGSVLARHHLGVHRTRSSQAEDCLLYTSDAADDLLCVDLCGPCLI
eukprot:TRINITY_DN24918_c0_g1_i1.p1 TRINITY_DN24918_c0_g1~~TRINITY_DN24918_c0_g1_i1.p1  ORF type:complete len:113 (+),score=31.99 TRINITY_DN24918_c0_g1_i1:77-415(+)